MTSAMKALTAAEARQRADLVAVSSYEVDLDLTLPEEGFGSRTVVRFTCAEPGAESFVELVATRILDARLNGTQLSAACYDGNRLRLAGLRQHNELVVDAELAYSVTGVGMHRFHDPVDGETYVGAYLGVDNAQRVFANFDQPDLKATITLSATAPTGWNVFSNGVGRRPGPPGRWEFATTPVLPTSLAVLIAGPWHTVRREHRGIGFALHCRRSLAAYLDKEAAEIFDITFACFDRYLELFDEPYPFDSYDQAFVPELNWGAMETPGCITFRDDFLFRSAVTEADRERRGSRHRARDGPHVVRGPGDDAMVGRPVAERVVRRVHGFPGSFGGDEVHEHLDRLLHDHETLGLRRRPTALHPPGCSGAG